MSDIAHDQSVKPKAAGARQPGGLRLDLLKQRLRERGFVSVAATATELGVSEMTIRRDLARLEALDVAIRTHGGAIARDGGRGERFDAQEPAFEARARENARGKAAIATAAAEIPKQQQTVGLDVGTTALELARQLTDKDGLKIFTNNLRAGMILSDSRHHVYLTGGQIRPIEYAAYGPIAIEQLAALWLDHAFIGVSGMTEEGCFDYSVEDTEMKRVYIERSHNVIVLCDAHKFERRSLVKVCDLSHIDMVVTDAEPPAALAGALLESGTQIIVAPSMAA